MRSSRLGFAPILLLALHACGGDDDSSADGNSAVAGFKACGGNPEGKWKVKSLTLADPSALVGGPLTNDPACKGAVGHVQINADGSYVFGKDKSYMVDVSYSIDMQLVLDNDCLQVLSGVDADSSICRMLQGDLSGQAGFDSVSCAFKNAACDCSLSLVATPISANATFSVRGDQLVVGSQSSDFCITGNRLELKVEAAPIAGLIVLER